MPKKKTALTIEERLQQALVGEVARAVFAEKGELQLQRQAGAREGILAAFVDGPQGP